MDYEKLKRFTKNYLLDCKWDNEGTEILSDDKLFLNTFEKEKIKFLISKCSPTNNLRKKLWLISSGAKKEMSNNKNYYKNLLKLTKSIKSLNEHQIKVDLNRTFPEEPFFQKEENIHKLKNILMCYSIRNSSIGYCQGFNFIVARLLEVFAEESEESDLEDKHLNKNMETIKSEEEVFWIFTQIIEDIMPINYYSELAGMITDCTITVNFIEKYLPDLYKFLIDNNFELSLNNFIHKWLISFFVQNFEKEVSLTIWDFFFLEGSIVLFKAALAVMKILKKSIMEDPSFEQIYYILNARTNDMSEFPNISSDLIFYLSLRKFEFDNEFLDKHRKNLQIPIIENIMQENETKLKMKQKQLEKAKESEKEKENSNAIFSTNSSLSIPNSDPKCDFNLPYCSEDLKEDFQHKVITFIPLRVKNYPPDIIENFFGKNYHLGFIHDFKEFHKEKEKSEFREDVLIERHRHRCKGNKDFVFYNKIDSNNVRKSNDCISNGFFIDSFDNSTDDGITGLSKSSKRVSHRRSYSNKLRAKEKYKKNESYEKNKDNTEENPDFTNFYKNIKQDKNFTIANNFLTTTFSAKPFEH